MNEMYPDDRRRYGYRDHDDDDDYRRNYRGDYRRGYDRRGGRNYREESFYEELENCMHELKEYSRALEDLADMAESSQDKNMLMRIAQKEKEHHDYLKQMLEK